MNDRESFSFYSSAFTATSETGYNPLVAAADRCARQIDFLRRRHRAQQEDWVRNHDNAELRQNATMTSTTTKRFPIIVVLDNVRSAFNVGSIFRTADACGCQEVLTVSMQYVLSVFFCLTILLERPYS